MVRVGTETDGSLGRRRVNVGFSPCPRREISRIRTEVGTGHYVCNSILWMRNYTCFSPEAPKLQDVGEADARGQCGIQIWTRTDGLSRRTTRAKRHVLQRSIIRWPERCRTMKAFKIYMLGLLGPGPRSAVVSIPEIAANALYTGKDGW